MELKSYRLNNVIYNVKKHSIAEEVGIEPGDILLSVNEVPIEDIIEYNFLVADEYIELEIQHKNGDISVFEIEKDFDESIGIEFSNPIIDSVKSCSNNCMFCFIDQLPAGMRETLYLKDDDSRLSFLQGNFITMTNMKEKDIEKIIRYRICPINISVHTTNEALRVKMLNNRFAGKINDYLDRLFDAKIIMNGQIVCIPEVNDREELDKTIRDLSRYYPYMESVAVVPVGITKFREKLTKIQVFDKLSAEQLISQIEILQKACFEKLGSRFVFASDEFYVMAEKEVPSEETYEGFIQLENGVGLIKKFELELMSALSAVKEGKSTEDYLATKLTVATGASAYQFMKTMSAHVMEKIHGIDIQVIKITNHYFGETITVAGLITGEDLMNQLQGIDIGQALLLPRVMFRSDEMVMLDDVTIENLQKYFNVKVMSCDINGQDFVSKICSVRR